MPPRRLRVGQWPGAGRDVTGVPGGLPPAGPCPFATPWLVGEDETGLTFGYWKV